MDMTEQTNSRENIPEYKLGDRVLYLRTPHFRGSDVEELQTVLLALGFACGGVTGTFGGYTEGALRKFQLNAGLEPDGIADVNTYATLKYLHGAWANKKPLEQQAYMSFARAGEVLESSAVCLFGTEAYTRMVASYMSNVALATNPHSKMISAESLLVAPDESMLLAHIVLPSDKMDDTLPTVQTDDSSALAARIRTAVQTARSKVQPGRPMRIAIQVEAPASTMDDKARSQLAHHQALLLLDSFCVALAE